MSCKLTALSEQIRGTKFTLDKTDVFCGRVASNDIVINDVTVSSRHCCFTIEKDTYKIKDLNSTNGTRVNNVPIICSVILYSGDIVQIGSVELMFEAGTNIIEMRKCSDMTQLDMHTNHEVRKSHLMLNLSPFAKDHIENKNSGKLFVAMIASMSVLVIFLLFVLMNLMNVINIFAK